MKIIVVVMALICLFSCSPDFYEIVNRDNSSPMIEKPHVACFVLENQITVYWDKDAAADEYLLYRDTSPTGQFNTLVYSGKGLAHTETGLSAPQVYYYKLAKRRQEMIFPKSACALAVSHTMRRDEWEDNNTPETATPFYNSLDANIFFYRDALGNRLDDVDWYQFDIPPGMSVTFGIWFPIASTIEPGELDYSEYGMTPANLIGTDDEFTIDNKATVTVTKKFNLSPNPGSTTSKIVSYQIKFISMQPAEP